MSRQALAGALACTMLSACTHAALGRFRNEYDCPSATVRDLGARGYRVTGCGREVDYVCAPFGLRPICVAQRMALAAPPLSAFSSPAPRSHAPLELEEGRIRGEPAVRLVIPQLDGAALVYAPALDARHVLGRSVAGLASRCENAVVAAGGGWVEAQRREDGRFAWPRESLDIVDRSEIVGITLCGRRADIGGAELSVLRAFIARAREIALVPRTSGSEATVPSAPPASSAANIETRAWLDANRETILACVNRATVVVRVESDGASTRVSLQGPLAGTPEEECVRTALGTPPSGAVPRGAAVIHPVR